jgi:hypothetical protein
MPSLFLSSLARPLVVLHAAVAFALVGAATHHALIAIGYLRGVFKIRLARVYATTVAATWLVTFALGLLSYPTFRITARAAYLDQYEPWASRLFELKEHAAALGIPLVLGAVALSRVFEPKRDRALARAYAAIVLLAAAIVWFDAFSGLAITLAKGV